MKMNLALAFGLLITATASFAQVNYSNKADINKAHSDIRISDVKYVAIPTKTEVREIPGCNPNGEASTDCTEVVVLERQPVVQVTVSYTEGVFRDQEGSLNEGHVYFNFRLTDFDSTEVAELKAATSLWDFTGRKFRIRKAFAKRNFELSAELATRTIQIVDVLNSRLCHETEAGPMPGCEEVLNYKPINIKIRELTVIKK